MRASWGPAASAASAAAGRAAWRVPCLRRNLHLAVCPPGWRHRWRLSILLLRPPWGFLWPPPAETSTPCCCAATAHCGRQAAMRPGHAAFQWCSLQLPHGARSHCRQEQAWQQRSAVAGATQRWSLAAAGCWCAVLTTTARLQWAARVAAATCWQMWGPAQRGTACSAPTSSRVAAVGTPPTVQLEWHVAAAACMPSPAAARCSAGGREAKVGGMVA